MSVIERTNIFSSSRWEPLRGYSRAVLVGNHLIISGTTAVNEKNEVMALNDPYEQTRYVVEIIRKVLASVSFTIHDVVRTRLHVTDLKSWDRYAQAHNEAFGLIRPASSIIEVARLTDPRMLVEMEVEAIRGAKTVNTIKI